MELFKTVPAYLMLNYLFLKILRFRYNIKTIKKIAKTTFQKFFRLLQSSGLNTIRKTCYIDVLDPI